MATVYKRGGRNQRGGRYYISYFDHNGQRVSRSARTTDKATAERIAAKLEADAALRRDGVIDRRIEELNSQSQRTIESHLVDFAAKMTAAKRSPPHVQRTLQCIRVVCAAADFTRAVDIAADGVNRVAAKLLDDGKSARTVHAHLVAIKTLTRWLVSTHKLAIDPLASVQKPNPKTDRRRQRRMLLHEEWEWLRRVTLAGPMRFGMCPEERTWLYALAIQTGLRAAELRSLMRGNLFLDASPPFILCRAGATKNRQEARLYLRPEMAEALQGHLATRTGKGAVFTLPSKFNMADMLRADLAAARCAWLAAAVDDPHELARRQNSDFLADVNHEGHVLDFHSLRHTCGAWLAIAGAHPKEIQTVMRHSTITLTMDTYGHLVPGQEALTIARLPCLLDVPKDSRRIG